MSREKPESLEAPKEIIESLELDFLFPNEQVFAQVATQSKKGPHIRTMRLYDLNHSGQLIFLTRTDTLKCQDLKEDPRISVCFLNQNTAQILAEGNAYLINDPKYITSLKKYWDDLPWEIKKIYSNQEDLDKTPSDFGLIVVQPELWEIIKLRKYYSYSERFLFKLGTYEWHKTKIGLTS